MCVRLYGGIAAASSASVHGARCCTCTHAPLFTLHTSQRADGGVRVARGAVRARGVLEAVDAEFNAARVRALPCEGLHDLDVVPDRQRRLRPLHPRQPARCSPPLPTRRSARPQTRRQAPEGREGGGGQWECGAAEGSARPPCRPPTSRARSSSIGPIDARDGGRSHIPWLASSLCISPAHVLLNASDASLRSGSSLPATTCSRTAAALLLPSFSPSHAARGSARRRADSNSTRAPRPQPPQPARRSSAASSGRAATMPPRAFQLASAETSQASVSSATAYE